MIETPFPAEGEVTPTDYGYSASLPFDSTWLTETESGEDYRQNAVDRAARKHGEGTTVRVRFTTNCFGEGCGGYELLGVVDESERASTDDCADPIADGGPAG
jgi:hypothetical protein